MKPLMLMRSRQEIHLAPGVKILPEKVVSTLLDLQELQHLVEQEIQGYREAVDQQADAQREQARQEGFAAGEQTWAEAVATLQASADQVAHELEEAMIPTVIKAVERIIGQQLLMQPDMIQSIVAKALQTAADYHQVVVYCRQEDLEELERVKPELQRPLELCKVLMIRPREDIEPGGCIIETEGGIVNAQLSMQLTALEKALRKRQRQQASEAPEA